MRYLITIAICIGMAGPAFSQGTTEVMPDYKGGIDVFYNYIRQNIRYPQQARAVGKEGILRVVFCIDNVKGIESIDVEDDHDGLFTQEIKRVLRDCPNNWKVGEKGCVLLPVIFKLDKSELGPPAELEVPQGVTVLSQIVVVGYRN